MKIHCFGSALPIAFLRKEYEQKIKMLQYLTALFYYDNETISGVGSLV